MDDYKVLNIPVEVIVSLTIQASVFVKFTNEQYATINSSRAGRFNSNVFVNC